MKKIIGLALLAGFITIGLGCTEDKPKPKADAPKMDAPKGGDTKAPEKKM